MGGAVESVVDVVEDAGSWVDDTVIQPILNDPIEAAATATAYYFGGPLAAGATKTAFALEEGKEFDQALKEGATAAAVSYAGGELAGGSTGGEAGAFDMGGVGNAMPGYWGPEYAGAGAFDVGGMGDVTGNFYYPDVAPGGAFEMGGMGDVTNRFVTPSNALKNTMDVLRTGNALRNMFGQQPAQIPNMQLSQVPQGVVDYSPLLSLLSQRATTPNVQSLLG